MPQMKTEKSINLQEDFYSQTIEDLLKKFDTSINGLTDNQAEEKLKLYGLNEIAKEKKKSIFRKIFDALIEPMALILIIASLLSFFIINDLLEALAIVGVVISSRGKSRKSSRRA